MRRMIVSLLGGALWAGIGGLCGADAPPASLESSVQFVANGRGWAGRGASGRPTVRRYRSYSIDPAPAGVVDGGAVGGVITPPRTSAPAPTPRRTGKPSYMRGDSKALGRFHQ